MVLIGMSGCVRESSNGVTQTFSYEWWLPLLVFLGGLVAAPAGWFLRQWSTRLGWGLLIIGPLAAIFFAPSLFLERTVITDTTFSKRSGIWGCTASNDISIGDLEQVSIISEQVRGRRGSKRTEYFLLCQEKGGKTEKVSINNDVSQAAAACFLERVSEQGILIVDKTQ